jgi:DNA-binding transcriptional MocR family regulator
MYIKGSSSVEISRSIEDAVRSGRLAPGERLPTVRGLARGLGVSPTTVASVYKTLRTRGLLVGYGRRGTMVSQAPPVVGRLPQAIPAGVRNLAHGNPDPEFLPALGPALRTIDDSHSLYGRELEVDALMRLARRDLERDGVATDCLAVTGGAMDGIERVLGAHLRPGDAVVVEDPGFTSVIDLLGALGLVPVPCAVDDRGLEPQALERALARDARCVIVTPRAQNPTGAAIDAGRAKALRTVLRAHPDVLLIEDDHCAGVAGAALHSPRDRSLAHWAFVRSVSKPLGPDLRLAIVAGDAETIARVQGRQLMGIRWVSHVLQRLAAALWADRATAALLKRAERVYGERRESLVDALARHGIEGHGRSGLNVWIPVPEEAAVMQALLQAGWAVAPGERFRLESGPGIRVTIATLLPQDAEKLAADLARVLGRGGRMATA